MFGGTLCMMKGVMDSRLSTKTESEWYTDVLNHACEKWLRKEKQLWYV